MSVYLNDSDLEEFDNVEYQIENCDTLKICPIEEEEVDNFSDTLLNSCSGVQCEEVNLICGSGSGHEKDSGISRTTDSEADLVNLSTSPAPATNQHTVRKMSNGRISNSINKQLTSRAANSPNDKTFAGGKTEAAKKDSRKPGKLVRSESEGSLAQELAHLHDEMQHIQLECDRLVSRYSSREQRVRTQMRLCNRFMADLDCMQDHLHFNPPFSKPLSKTAVSQKALSALVGKCHRKGEDSSSAYNTGGDSCRSTPQHQQLLDDGSYMPMLAKCSVVCPPKSILKSGVGAPPMAHNVTIVSNPAVAASLSSDSDSDSSVDRKGYQPGQLMYTSCEQLHRTIALQQRVLRQAMLCQPQQPSATRQPDPCQPLSPADAHFWKIKRRSDGTRYFTRRPVRNRILRDRAEKVCRERAGTSTDDDAFSELKLGRYWTREERKRHLEKARERKQRQEQLLNCKAEQMLVKRSSVDCEADIVALYNRKAARRKGKQLLDKYTTIQEFLIHGNHALDAGRGAAAVQALGLLSVTTV